VGEAPPALAMPSDVVIASATKSSSRTGVRSTNQVPSGNCAPARRAASTARRVLPTPPVPVSVTSREEASAPRTASSSTARPTTGVSGAGTLPVVARDPASASASARTDSAHSRSDSSTALHRASGASEAGRSIGSGTRAPCTSTGTSRTPTAIACSSSRRTGSDGSARRREPSGARVSIHEGPINASTASERSIASAIASTKSAPASMRSRSMNTREARAQRVEEPARVPHRVAASVADEDLHHTVLRHADGLDHGTFASRSAMVGRAPSGSARAVCGRRRAAVAVRRPRHSTPHGGAS
jgi:hypothetical protein